MSTEDRLERIERILVMSVKEVLNTCEVALMLNVSEQRIRQMMYERTIPHYKRGGKAFFKKSEIESWMLKERIPTNDEVKSKAVTYIAIKNIKK